MDAWIKCSADFTMVATADIVRWTEPIWDTRRRRKRPLRIGTRKVEAELLTLPDSEGWVRVRVRDCRAEVEQIGAGNGMLEKGKEMPRKVSTLLRCGVERMRWTDESVRSIVVSRFLNEPPPPPPSAPPPAMGKGSRKRCK